MKHVPAIFVIFTMTGLAAIAYFNASLAKIYTVTQVQSTVISSNILDLSTLWHLLKKNKLAFSYR